MKKTRFNSILASAMLLSCTAMTATHDAMAAGGGAPTAAKPPVVFEDMVSKLFKRSATLEADLMHAAVGMSGESTELIVAYYKNDKVNLLEELGDFRFYLQFIFHTFGWSHQSFQVPDTVQGYYANHATSLAVASGDVLDLIKKTWVYGKEIDVLALYDAVALVYFHYNQLAFNAGIDENAIKAANVYKLVTGPKARFAEGYYTDAAAIARADKVEDTPLETSEADAVELDFNKAATV